tara:strand:+ start:939 stop:1838 length:900 start_codon:yes stop_codon:yes gene_type:complete
MPKSVTKKELEFMQFCKALAEAEATTEKEFLEIAQELGFVKNHHTVARAKVPYNEWLATPENWGWKQFCVEQGWTSSTAKGLPASTQRPAKHISIEEWKTMSKEEKEAAALEHGSVSAHLEERTQAWTEFQNTAQYHTLCDEIALENAKAGKAPPKTVKQPNAPSHKDLDSELEQTRARIEKMKAEKEKKSKKKAPPNKFDEIDKNGDGVVDREEFEEYEQKKQHKLWCLKQFETSDKESKANNAKYYFMREHPEEFGIGKENPGIMSKEIWKEVKDEINYKQDYKASPWFGALLNDSK